MKRTPRTKPTPLGNELRRIADQYESHAKAYERGESAHKVDPHMAALSLGRAEGLRDAAAKVDAANGYHPLSAKELLGGLVQGERVLAPLSLEERVTKLEADVRAVLDGLAMRPASRSPEASPAPAAKVAPPATALERGSPRTVEVDPLSAMERKILTALAQLGAAPGDARFTRPLSVEAVLLVTGYRPSGHFTAAMARLRVEALIAGPSSALVLTEVGGEMLGEYVPLPRGGALVAHWARVLGAMAGRILRLAVEHPQGMIEADVLGALGYSKSGHFTRALADLRKLSILTPRGEIQPTAEFLSVLKG